MDHRLVDPVANEKRFECQAVSHLSEESSTIPHRDYPDKDGTVTYTEAVRALHYLTVYMHVDYITAEKPMRA